MLVFVNGLLEADAKVEGNQVFLSTPVQVGQKVTLVKDGIVSQLTEITEKTCVITIY